LTSGGLNLTVFVITDLLYSTLKQNIIVADEIIINYIKDYSKVIQSIILDLLMF